LRDCFAWAKRSGADVFVTIDADGQHDPAVIPKLIEKMREENADVVIGSRLAAPRDMPSYRWLGGRALDNLAGVKVGGRTVDAQSGFRACVFALTTTFAIDCSSFKAGIPTRIFICDTLDFVNN